MKNFMTIVALLSLTSLIHADCSCVKHTPKDHLDTRDARAVGKEVGRNLPNRIAGDIKEGAHQTKQQIEDDVNYTKNKVQNSRFAQSAKETMQCMCDKSKCALHNTKQKADEVVDATKDLAQKAGQFTKEVVAKTGNTLKETAYKVGHDISEGFDEAKADVSKAKERAKRS